MLTNHFGVKETLWASESFVFYSDFLTIRQLVVRVAGIIFCGSRHLCPKIKLVYVMCLLQAIYSIFGSYSKSWATYNMDLPLSKIFSLISRTISMPDGVSKSPAASSSSDLSERRSFKYLVKSWPAKFNRLMPLTMTKPFTIGTTIVVPAPKADK